MTAKRSGRTAKIKLHIQIQLRNVGLALGDKRYYFIIDDITRKLPILSGNRKSVLP